MATCLDVAGAQYPKEFRGKPVTPLEGRSLLPALQGKTRQGHPTIGWEHQGHRALRQGDWKLVARNRQSWELYNLAEDRTERNDLAAKDPARAAALAKTWQGWADRCGVVPFDSLAPARKA
jgi:arylsulfatase